MILSDLSTTEFYRKLLNNKNNVATLLVVSKFVKIE